MLYTIIIPAKNESANLAACLKSLHKMDCGPDLFEIIVIDNGSTDDTAAVAARMGERIVAAPGATIAAMRNLGARSAKGEILAFLDADCTVDPEWLKQAGRYVGQQEIHCFGAPPVIPEPATWVQLAWFHVRCKPVQGERTEWLESMNMFVRSAAFRAIGGFDENLVTCEDYDFCLRLRRAGMGRIIADHRIRAVHHGEAADIKTFWRKERWRGISNLKAALSHGLTFRELPSLLSPFFYWPAVICLLVGGIGFAYRSSMLAPMLLIGLSCQCILMLLAFSKSGLHNGSITKNIVSGAQVFCLLNVYFAARGCALLAGHSRRAAERRI